MKRIEEIYWLRFYGCLAVFAFHLVDRIERNHFEHVALDLTRIPTVLGTPIFIFISIFLFSARYGREVPHHFLATRLKYVMGPYVAYGLIYSIAEYLRLQAADERVDLLPHMVEYLVFAGWHGYFLIIAMQFYILFWLYNRLDLWRWMPSGPWLVVGAVISMAYWAFWRFQPTEPPGYLHWIAPVGWIYLFFLARLVVKHYQGLAEQAWFRRFSHPGWLVALVAVIVVLTLRGELYFSSKETWVVPLFILSLLWAMRRLAEREAPPLVRKVNEYSFGIYLAHPLFFSVVDFIGWQVAIPVWGYPIALAVVGMSGSIWLNKLANRAEWSSMLLGKRLTVR